MVLVELRAVLACAFRFDHVRKENKLIRVKSMWEAQKSRSALHGIAHRTWKDISK